MSNHRNSQFIKLEMSIIAAVYTNSSNCASFVHLFYLFLEFWKLKLGLTLLFIPGVLKIETRINTQ